ncbi:MAG: PKD domain-containing protein [Candidatus Cloacimonetes bacterium]|nr:PKD domain-containing protein [Candidatus Cloacimonadota bacterium]
MISIKEKLKIMFFITLFLATINSLHSQSTHIVNHDGSGNFTSIQTAINFASNGDTIIVYPGTYNENLNIISKSIFLGSLFSTTGDENFINQTIIDGQKINSVINIHYAQYVTIEGFTIQNGLSHRVWGNGTTEGLGGGIQVFHSNNVAINYNFVINNIAGLLGGGISVSFSNDVTFTANTIYKNMAMHAGGGLYSDSGQIPGISSIEFNINGPKNNIYMNSARFSSDIFLVGSDFSDIHIGIGTLNYVNPWSITSRTPTNFIIEQGYVTEIDSDFFVCSAGDDSNDGLTPLTALRSITMAVTKVMSNPDKINTIHLSAGIHGIEAGNIFPIHLKSQLKLIGECRETTIIDIGGYSWGISSQIYDLNRPEFVEPQYITLKNFTIKNVYNSEGRWSDDRVIYLDGLSFDNIHHIENIRYDERNSLYHNQGRITSVNAESLTMKNIEIFRVSKTLYDYYRWGIDISLGLNVNLENILLDGGNYGIQITAQRPRFVYNEISHHRLSNILMRDLHTRFFEDPPYLPVSAANAIVIQGRLSDDGQERNIVSIINSTFVNNTHTDHHYLINALDSIQLEIYNCIFYNNHPDNRIYLYAPNSSATGTAIFSHNLIENGTNAIIAWPAVYWDITLDKNIEGNPDFVEIGEHPEMLLPGSLGIGSGTTDIANYTFPEFDLAGNPRIVNGQISIGAYEFHPTGLVAGFTADVTSGTVPLTVQFTDLSIGNIISWDWDFNNDGIIDSTEQNPVYVFDEIGEYSVTLTINSGESIAIKPNFIVVWDTTNTDFIASPLIGYAPLEVVFNCLSTGNINSWDWDFDSDGIIDSTEQNPVFVYNEGGIYSVTLTVNDGESFIVKNDFIVVMPPITADFTASPLIGVAPLEVQFTDLSIGAVSWVWDFGIISTSSSQTRTSLISVAEISDFPVTSTTSTEQNPIFIFEEEGEYTITLTINDGESSITKPDFILVVPPVYANFSAEPLSGHAPLEVQFTDQSFGAFSWAWDFDNDGSIDSIEQNPVFIFKEVGVYTVTLTINDGESINTKLDFIVVTQPVKADFTAEPTTGTAPLEVQFTCLSTGAFAWEWDFNNDGTVDSTEQNPVFTYLTSGIYTVTLTINNGEDTITKQDFIDSTVSEDDETVLPFTGVNLQSFPNPVNISRSSHTLISFDTKEKAIAEPTIEIYNIRGQKVRTLRTGMSFLDLAILVGIAQENLNYLRARNYSVVWDMRDESNTPVSSGIYFYRAIVDGEIVGTNRMVVIK